MLFKYLTPTINTKRGVAPAYIEENDAQHYNLAMRTYCSSLRCGAPSCWFFLLLIAGGKVRPRPDRTIGSVKAEKLHISTNETQPNKLAHHQAATTERRSTA